MKATYQLSDSKAMRPDWDIIHHTTATALLVGCLEFFGARPENVIEIDGPGWRRSAVPNTRYRTSRHGLQNAHLDN